MKGLNLDSKFIRGLNTATDLLLLNLLWLLTSLPIITIGISTCAVYGVLGMRARDEEGGIVASYFRYWKREWKMSGVLWLIQLVISAFLLYNFLSGYNQSNPVAALLAWASFIVLIIISAVFTLTYPMVVRYKNRMGEYIRNAALLFRGNILRTLLQLVVLSMPFVMALYMWDLFLRTLPFWLLLGISILLKICYGLQRKIFLPLEAAAADTECDR